VLIWCASTAGRRLTLKAIETTLEIEEENQQVLTGQKIFKKSRYKKEPKEILTYNTKKTTTLHIHYLVAARSAQRRRQLCLYTILSQGHHDAYRSPLIPITHYHLRREICNCAIVKGGFHSFAIFFSFTILKKGFATMRHSTFILLQPPAIPCSSFLLAADPIPPLSPCCAVLPPSPLSSHCCRPTPSTRSSATSVTELRQPGWRPPAAPRRACARDSPAREMGRTSSSVISSSSSAAMEVARAIAAARSFLAACLPSRPPP
jgi:hypothetical protein